MKLHYLIVALLWLFAATGGSAQTSYEILFIQNNTDDIIDQVQQKINLDKATTEDFYWGALAFEKAGKPIESINWLQMAMEKYPDTQKIEKKLAETYFENGNYTLAIPLLAKYSTDPDCLFLRSKIFEFDEKRIEANTCLKKLYRMDTTNQKYLRHLADNYYRLDYLDSAALFYGKILMFNPLNQFIAILQSKTLLRLDQYDNALAVCEPILRENPENTKFLKQMGYVYFKRKKYEQAVGFFKQCLQLNDTSVFVYKYLGISQISSNDFHPGRENLIVAYSKDTADFDICFFLARGYLNSTHKEKGLQFIAKANEIIQPSGIVMDILCDEKVSILASMGRTDEVIQTYKEAYRFSANPAHIFHLGSTYLLKKKDNEKALSYFEDFLGLLSNSSDKGHTMEHGTLKISMRRIAEENIKKIREELFFEGKLQE